MIDEIKNAVVDAALRPKVALATSAGAAASGIASYVNVLQGWTALATTVVGLITALFVATIQGIKMVRVWRDWRPDSPNIEVE